MPKSIFSKFISGELHCSKIYEDELTFAFLDQSPVTKGHTLVIPKEEIDHIDDCSEELYSALFKTARKVSRQLHNKLKPLRVALVVIGTEVPHAHIHVVPLYTGKELHLVKRDNAKLGDDVLDPLADKLKFNPTV